MINCFIARLREKVRLGVKMFLPTSLSAVTNLARLEEQKSMASRKFLPNNNRIGLTGNIGTSKSVFP